MGIGLVDELCIGFGGAAAMGEEDVVVEDAVVMVEFNYGNGGE